MKKFFIRLLVFVAVFYVILLIPDRDSKPLPAKPSVPFAWKQDSVWRKLEADFREARTMDTAKADSMIEAMYHRQDTVLHKLLMSSTTNDPRVLSVYADEFLPSFFEQAPFVAARPEARGRWIATYNSVRNVIKKNAVYWNMNDPEIRTGLYKTLYGMRAAVEETLLQSKNFDADSVMLVESEHSSTPSIKIAGIEAHSGDLFVSRGGAEVSAMISRGNDFPGNFSHVALLYVDEKGNGHFIEAHIEKGVAIATPDEYLADKKLRFMVLRPRWNLTADSMLPRKAAAYAYTHALSRHIPYDFKMNFHDTTAMFCSEVGSDAYKHVGIELWKSISTISSTGVMNWLHQFGVENFVTQMPSDLEYDPQLSIVAEWRNTAALRKDHIDNAVMDVLLEKADSGKAIVYPHWQLPFVRVIKGWCMIKNLFHTPGVIPEGMSATQALKNQAFVKMYQELRKATEIKIAEFVKANGYYPPYWKLIEMARAVG